MPKHSMMLHQSDRLSRKSQLSVFSSLIFRHAVAVLLLTHPHGGHSQQMGQPQPIVATVGDDITLPCHVKPVTDAVNMMLEWSRPDLNPRFVHVRRSGDDHLVDQNQSYRGRTSASIEGLKQGDMSLKLSKVKLSDEGTYRCYVPQLNTETSVQLVVGAAIEITKVGNGELECKSKGWHQEPEVFWLDGEGNLLSAEPAAAVRGPDDLYTVSSRVTVEKRHGNNFTCRVQQKDTNHRRETYVYVTDDFFTDSSSSSAPIIIGVFVGIMFILAVAFVVWKWNKNKTNNQSNRVDERRVSNSVNTRSEKESLMKAETDREKTAAGETMKNHNEVEEENHTESQPVTLTTGGQSDNVLIQVQSADVGTGSHPNPNPVMKNGGETMNDSDKRSVSDDTQTPDQAERETGQEKPEENVGTRKAEEGTNLVNAGAEGPGATDGGGQQQDTAGGEAQPNLDEKETKKQTQITTNNTTNNGPDNQGPADEATQENGPPAGGPTMDGLVKSEEATEPSSEDRHASDPAETDPHKEKPETDVDVTNGKDKSNSANTVTAAQGLLHGGEQQQDRAGGETNTALDKKEDTKQKQNTNNRSEGQHSTTGGIQENDPPGEGGTKTDINTGLISEDKYAPGPPERGEREGNNRDSKDGGEDTTSEQENTTKPTINEPAGQGATDGRIRGNNPSAGGGTDSDSENAGGTEAAEEDNPCPAEGGHHEMTPDSRAPDQLTNAKGRNNLDNQDADNKAAGQGPSREELQAGDEVKPEEDTNSVSNKTRRLSSGKTETDTKQHTETAKDPVTEDRPTDDGSSV